MKQVFRTSFLLLALIVAALAAYSWENREKSSQVVAQEPTMTMQKSFAFVEQATPTLMLTPSAVPSPTVDGPVLTALAAIATETERVLYVNLQISQNNAKFADALSTQNVIEQQKLAGTSTAAPGAATATLAAQSTENYLLMQGWTATAEYPTAIVAAASAEAAATVVIANAEATAKTALPNQVLQIVLFACLAVLCLVFAGVAVGVIRRKPAPQIIKQNIMHIEKDDESGVQRVPDPPVDDHESFLNWCAAALAGESVAVDPWEKGGRFIGNYRQLYIWLVRWELLMRDPLSGRTVLNPKGERTISGWMMANPLPHPGIDAEIAPLPPVNTESVCTETEGE